MSSSSSSSLSSSSSSLSSSLSSSSSSSSPKGERLERQESQRRLRNPQATYLGTPRTAASQDTLSGSRQKLIEAHRSAEKRPEAPASRPPTCHTASARIHASRQSELCSRPEASALGAARSAMSPRALGCAEGLCETRRSDTLPLCVGIALCPESRARARLSAASAVWSRSPKTPLCLSFRSARRARATSSA